MLLELGELLGGDDWAVWSGCAGLPMIDGFAWSVFPILSLPTFCSQPTLASATAASAVINIVYFMRFIFTLLERVPPRCFACAAHPRTASLCSKKAVCARSWAGGIGRSPFLLSACG